MKIGNYARHLNEMAKVVRGPALHKDGEPRHYLYRFRNPLLQPFVKIVGRTKGTISAETEHKLQWIQDAAAPSTVASRPVGS